MREDPAKGFLPSIGVLKYFDLPKNSKRNPVRVETGVEMGNVVSTHYDPMLAKIIVHRATRIEAATALEVACASAKGWPVKTNAPFLINALNHDAFIEGDLDTGFIERESDILIPESIPPENGLQSVAWLVLARACGSQEQSTSQLPMEGWDCSLKPELVGFRLNAPRAPSLVRLTDGKNDFEVVAIEMNYWDSEPVEIVDDGFLLSERGQYFMLNLSRTDGSAHGPASSGNILSPMPGRIIAVEVTQGQSVTKGQKLLTLEAMKMEHSLTAPFDGVVAELNATPGAQVQVEALLVRIDALE
jgi:3-methylcrotonyl-CoA carboxylase alpha subunit